MTRTPTSLLIVRAWIEPDSAQPLRAHVRATTDVSHGFDSELTFSSMESVSTAVERWLEEVVAANEASPLSP